MWWLGHRSNRAKLSKTITTCTRRWSSAWRDSPQFKLWTVNDREPAHTMHTQATWGSNTQEKSFLVGRSALKDTKRMKSLSPKHFEHNNERQPKLIDWHLNSILRVTLHTRNITHGNDIMENKPRPSPMKRSVKITTQRPKSNELQRRGRLDTPSPFVKPNKHRSEKTLYGQRSGSKSFPMTIVSGR